jgi:carbon-monoxide dehydrogenase large subunit
MAYSRHVGARVKRKEDPRLITGSGTYVDDIQPRGLAHAAILRSTYAHAKLKSIDTSAAKALPGVIGVYTGAELKHLYRPMPFGGAEGAESADEDETKPKPVVTWAIEPEQARHVGQAIAVVVAESAAIARDALDAISVDYEPLPVVANYLDAVKDGAPRIYEHIRNNVGLTWSHVEGDVDAALGEADAVIHQVITNQRVASVSMETRAVLAQPEALGGLTLYTSTQNPHTVRTQIASNLGLRETEVRVVAPEVGGGFGAKINVYPEDVAISALARLLNRPIKWSESRSENMATTHHGRAQHAEFWVGAKQDGTITAVRMRLIADLGAYPRDSFIPVLTGWLLAGVYHCRNYDMQIRGVFSNTMATGAYRGAGRPEAAYYMERLVDLVAQRLGLDPVEVRRKNFIPPDAFPYNTPTGLTYDSGEYAKALDKALEVSNYAELRAEQAQARAQGRLVGIGLSTFTEICGFGPYDSASVRVEPTGQVTVSTGVSPHGQGSETTFAQIVADELGISMDDIVVVHGDTARTPQGIGTMGSRSLVVGGSALYRASGVVREKARKIAAHLMEASPEDVEVRDGAFRIKGAPQRATTLAQIAAAAYGGGVPDEIGTGLEALDFFRPPSTTFPFGADVAVVEVDPATGVVNLQKYVAVDDCGTVISPLLVEGQVHGGLAQGIAQALWEEVVYDEGGQLITGSLMDYAVPVAEGLPSFVTDRTVTTSPHNPLGAKGIGELATIGSAPTVVNAVMDALAPLGITHLDMPLRPEKVWKAIQAAKK